MVNEAGQSLVEVVIALAVAIVVIVALIVLVLSGLKNAQFAQTQLRATQYANGILEKVEAVSDRDGNVEFTKSPPGTVRFSSLRAMNLSSAKGPCSVVSPSAAANTDGCYFQLIDNGSGQFSLKQRPLNSSAYSQDDFRVEILISDKPLGARCDIVGPTPPAQFLCDYTQEKVVTIKVAWSDNGGEHESNLQTILTPSGLTPTPAPTATPLPAATPTITPTPTPGA